MSCLILIFGGIIPPIKCYQFVPIIKCLTSEIKCPMICFIFLFHFVLFSRYFIKSCYIIGVYPTYKALEYRLFCLFLSWFIQLCSVWCLYISKQWLNLSVQIPIQVQKVYCISFWNFPVPTTLFSANHRIHHGSSKKFLSADTPCQMFCLILWRVAHLRFWEQCKAFW